ncbi:two-component system, NarL family, sensor histidine kinase UhpB [Mariprofundus micogutta]|uniref:histidine kinase n=1 Tax=Mariprofundus micogutta TaxID=1921010 RepID=A0A1L8CRB2_9PROT|nr:PAS domain S-box protein [Mariprofundus micogutta]GAV21359.1 two-component system, NarL family, sensor histidine kinase UhpB [Mariprofundus micogutta]
MVAGAFYKKRSYLILIMVSVSLAVLGIVFSTLYATAFEEQRSRLIETAQSRAALMNAIARFNKQHSGANAFNDTLGQIEEAHQQFAGFGETGEFTLGKREADQIIFLLSHRHHDLSNPHPVAFKGTEAEPMRLALSGRSGSLVGRDYRNEMVLAAYEPVQELNLGVVTKIDLAEIRAPFIRAGLISSVSALALILLGSSLFMRITRGMEQELEHSEELFRNTFKHTAIGMAHIAPDGGFLRVNQAICNMLGYKPRDLMTRSTSEITHPDDYFDTSEQMQHLIDDRFIRSSLEKRCVRKDGSVITTDVSISLVRNPSGDPDYFIVTVTDISDRIELQKELRDSLEALEIKNESLNEAISTINTISGIVPLCAWCGRTIRDDDGQWVGLESYFETHTDAKVSHGMCPDCKIKFEKEMQGKSDV